MQTKPFRIGTRGSALALAQAEEVRARLMSVHDLEEAAFEIVVISTLGDRVTDRPLSEIGGKGLFTKEIEEALLDGRIDIAVHSSKDMPTVLPDGLELSAFLEREDPRDAFIGRDCQKLIDLPQGARVGSSSLRRQALIRRIRPDLQVEIFRGNVQTRLKKLADGVVDATLLANAGLRRLGLESVISQLLPMDEFPPAPGQGAICIESRIGDAQCVKMISRLHHRDTGLALSCERGFLAALDGSCRTPIAGHAVISGDNLQFHGMILSPDGAVAHDTSTEGAVADAAKIGRAQGELLRHAAGPGFFDDWS